MHQVYGVKNWIAARSLARSLARIAARMCSISEQRARYPDCSLLNSILKLTKIRQFLQMVHAGEPTISPDLYISPPWSHSERGEEE